MIKAKFIRLEIVLSDGSILTIPDEDVEIGIRYVGYGTNMQDLCIRKLSEIDKIKKVLDES